MTIEISCAWTPQPEAGDWASQNFMDFTVDVHYKFNVGTTVQSEKITPKFLIIDNTQNTNFLTLTMGVLNFTIPAATRCSVAYPEGMSRFEILSNGATGTASVIVAEKKYIDDVSNQTASSGGSTGGALSIVRTIYSTVGADTHTVAADCVAFEVEVISGAGGGGTGNTVSGAGSGANSGTYARRLYTGVAPGTVCNLVVGDGGSSSTAGDASSFTDGVDAINCPGGNDGVNISTSRPAKNTLPTGGDVNYRGQRGEARSGNSGGDGGTLALFGLGGVGTTGVGDPGDDYGGGGSGGGNSASNNGGAGGQGAVIVTEYIQA